MKAEDLHSYYCEECDEWTYIDELKWPEEVNCAHCATHEIYMSVPTYEKIRQRDKERMESGK